MNKEMKIVFFRQQQTDSGHKSRQTSMKRKSHRIRNKYHLLVHTFIHSPQVSHPREVQFNHFVQENSENAVKNSNFRSRLEDGNGQFLHCPRVLDLPQFSISFHSQSSTIVSSKLFQFFHKCHLTLFSRNRIFTFRTKGKNKDSLFQGYSK